MDVARDAFVRDGVETSLEEIARQAGVGIGTLYRRFPTREDLIAAVLAERYERLADSVDELAATREPGDALWCWLESLMEHMSTYRGLSQSVKDAIHDRTTSLGATCGRMIDGGERLLAAAQKAGSVREDVGIHDVTSLVSGITWSAERRAEKGHDVGPLDTALLLDVVMRGLER
jgi:AcrR family transcriptional regulator